MHFKGYFANIVHSDYRTPLRRCHQAAEVAAVNLGKEGVYDENFLIIIGRERERRGVTLDISKNLFSFFSTARNLCSTRTFMVTLPLKRLSSLLDL